MEPPEIIREKDSINSVTLYLEYWQACVGIACSLQVLTLLGNPEFVKQPLRLESNVVINTALSNKLEN